MTAPRPERPGLQAERTQLAWERNAFSFLIAGAIPLLGHALDAGRLILPMVGAALALLTVYLGRRRATNIAAAPRIEVLLLGWGTAAFAALIVAVSLL